MRKSEVAIGDTYQTRQYGEVQALETNRAKVFCRVWDTGKTVLISCRSLNPVLAICLPDEDEWPVCQLDFCAESQVVADMCRAGIAEGLSRLGVAA